MNVITAALDALALALTNHDHEWTDDERQLYEAAVSIFDGDCMETDLSALETCRVH